MKFALLIAILAVSGLSAKSVDVIFEGTLTCNTGKSWAAYVAIFEDDSPLVDDFVKSQVYIVNEKTTKFKVSGTASDTFSFWDDDVEPRFWIRTTCGDATPFVNTDFIDYKTTLCTDYPKTRENLHVVMDIDLLNPPKELVCSRVF